MCAAVQYPSRYVIWTSNFARVNPLQGSPHFCICHTEGHFFWWRGESGAGGVGGVGVLKVFVESVEGIRHRGVPGALCTSGVVRVTILAVKHTNAVCFTMWPNGQGV